VPSLFRNECPGGGTGRRAGFKILYWQRCVGSIPTPGTKTRERNGARAMLGSLVFFFTLTLILFFFQIIFLGQFKKLSESEVGTLDFFFTLTIIFILSKHLHSFYTLTIILFLFMFLHLQNFVS
jgi:hypothetical protein